LFWRCVLVIVLFNSFVNFGIITNHLQVGSLASFRFRFPLLGLWWIFNMIQMWSFPWTILGQFYYTSHLWIGNPSNIILEHFKDSTNVFIQFHQWSSLWPLVASYNTWPTFLVLLKFWFWLNFQMALYQSQWVKCSIG